MICKKCGELLDERARYCPVCGAKQEKVDLRKKKKYLNPVHDHEDDCAHEGYAAREQADSLNPRHTHQKNCAHDGYAGGSRRNVSFGEAFKLVFLRYADFHGRSSRSEYWFGYLSLVILSMIAGGILGDFAWIWSLIALTPTLSLAVRRLHDIGRSGRWCLVALIPMVGQILVLVWACMDSTGDNIWGPKPR